MVVRRKKTGLTPILFCVFTIPTMCHLFLAILMIATGCALTDTTPFFLGDGLPKIRATEEFEYPIMKWDEPIVTIGVAAKQLEVPNVTLIYWNETTVFPRTEEMRLAEGSRFNGTWKCSLRKQDPGKVTVLAKATNSLGNTSYSEKAYYEVQEARPPDVSMLIRLVDLDPKTLVATFVTSLTGNMPQEDEPNQITVNCRIRWGNFTVDSKTFVARKSEQLRFRYAEESTFTAPMEKSYKEPFDEYHILLECTLPPYIAKNASFEVQGFHYLDRRDWSKDQPKMVVIDDPRCVLIPFRLSRSQLYKNIMYLIVLPVMIVLGSSVLLCAYNRPSGVTTVYSGILIFLAGYLFSPSPILGFSALNTFYIMGLALLAETTIFFSILTAYSKWIMKTTQWLDITRIEWVTLINFTGLLVFWVVFAFLDQELFFGFLDPKSVERFSFFILSGFSSFSGSLITMLLEAISRIRSSGEKVL